MTKLTERLKNRGWKLKMGDIAEIANLEIQNDEMRELLAWLRTTNMFHGNAIRTGFDGVVHPITNELANIMDHHISKGEVTNE